MNYRFSLVLFSLILLWAVMIFNGVNLQIVPHSKLDALKQKQFKKVITLKSRRGLILDRNSKELAITVASYSLYADPKIIKNPVATSRLLSKKLGLSSRKIFKKIKNRRKRFVWIKRYLDKQDKKKISQLKVRGLSFIEEPKRVYPNENLMAQALGFVGTEDYGLEGLELKFDDYLQATNKKIRVSKDARGRPLLVNGQLFRNNPDGANLYLTVDRELQFILERELARAVEEFEAQSAVGVILQADTSEILAMANVPTFNLNRASYYTASIRKNRSVTDAFEPGSTFKTFAVASALKYEEIKPSTKIDCENGKFKLGRRTVREADSDHHFGVLTVSEVLARSSNIGSSKVALRVGSKRLRQTLKDFGFGQKLQEHLPGESEGILNKLPWSKHLTSTVSFGHGVSSTPLQVANAYAVIANGGLLKKPFIVREISHPDSKDKIHFKPTTVRRVLTPEQAATMRIMLTSATASEYSTGGNAKIKGYPVAGKTGTAQKVKVNGKGYLKGGYISSFAGFIPANKPEFVIYIAVDHPKKQYYGSQVAAPVFSRVGRYALRKYGIPPVLIHQNNVISENKNLNQKQKRALKKIADEVMVSGVVPDILSLSLREALQRIKGLEAQVKIRGRGRVAALIPGVGERLQKGQKLYIQLE